MGKSADAFRTISEVADWLEVPAHVLRFWESKFTQVKPVKRAGGRRYYRPADMRLLGGIKVLLHDEGMTIKGVQKMLREQGVSHVAALSPGFEGEQATPTPVAQVLSFARPDAPQDATAQEPPSDPEPEPEPTTAAEPEPEPQTEPEPAPEPQTATKPGSEPEPEPEPEAASAPEPAPDPQAPALPSLPDLPDDPPDDMAAAPGPLARLATLPRPLPADLAATLSALAERLRDAGAPKA
ncbi:MerR family transcriptional regulator [Roseovarius nitratireducens]|uniref:MerR family transcriptional regulator n=1 Tax=Roseovarius nitratireducens TaxID=2044597 RepID=UPI000CE23AB6|nr:MerR family transcriptional regulator [Roseovarius nitratireducens]